MEREAKTSAARLIIIGLALAGAVAVGAALMRGSPGADDPAVAQAKSDMTSDLRGLAALEYTSRRLLGRYNSDPASTGHLSSVGVNAPVVTLVDSGYTAVVTHARVPKIRCGMGVYAPNPVSRWARSGEIVCK